MMFCTVHVITTCSHHTNHGFASKLFGFSCISSSSGHSTSGLKRHSKLLHSAPSAVNRLACDLRMFTLHCQLHMYSKSCGLTQVCPCFWMVERFHVAAHSGPAGLRKRPSAAHFFLNQAPPKVESSCLWSKSTCKWSKSTCK